MARHNESALQQTLIKWWALAHRGLGVSDERLLFAIPNGGKRDAITGARMKAEGARAGVPDLFLAVRRNLHSGCMVIPTWGLFIEMKTWEGKPTQSQIEVMAALRAQGYEAVLCRGVDQAMRAITQYLQEKEIAL